MFLPGWLSKIIGPNGSPTYSLILCGSLAVLMVPVAVSGELRTSVNLPLIFLTYALTWRCNAIGCRASTWSLTVTICLATKKGLYPGIQQFVTRNFCSNGNVEQLLASMHTQKRRQMKQCVHHFIDVLLSLGGDWPHLILTCHDDCLWPGKCPRRKRKSFYC